MLKIKKNKKKRILKFFLFLLFLFLTPWFNQLVYFGFDKNFFSINFQVTNFVERIIKNTSLDYLFFHGPKVVSVGLFYTFQLLLIFFGFYFLIVSTFYKKILLLVFTGLLIGSFFKENLNWFLIIFYFLPLQVVSFLGLLYLIKILKKVKFFFKILFFFFVFFTFYEILFYFHLLNIHYSLKLIPL